MDCDSGRIHMVRNEDELKELMKQYANLLQVKPNDITKLQLQRMQVSQYDTRSTLGKIRQRHIAKVGRNAPCPCGSGHKYKKCCLK